jgi:hypothetical protein
MTLTVARLREVLSYDPTTGAFMWRVQLGRRGRVGAVAGTTHSYGYRVIGIDGRYCLAHRLVWLYIYDEWPSGGLDYIDGNPANNAIVNLRPASQQQNVWSSRKRRDNKCGFKGVGWHRPSRSWRARIEANGRRIILGYFATAEEAHAAYMRAARELFGEFARAA